MPCAPRACATRAPCPASPSSSWARTRRAASTCATRRSPARRRASIPGCTRCRPIRRRSGSSASCASLNADPAVHGILVQLPLPKPLDARAVIEAIDPAKDVDGFHYHNVGALVVGEPAFYPCTPWGVMKMLEHEGIAVEGAARGRRRPLDDRRQAHGADAPQRRRHGDDLPLEDARPRRHHAPGRPARGRGRAARA